MMRILFHSQTCVENFESRTEELRTAYTALPIRVQYPDKSEWMSGVFYIVLGEFQIESNQDTQFLSTLESLAKLTKKHEETTCRHQLLVTRAWYTRRLFRCSKKCLRPLDFRLKMIESLVDNGLYNPSFVENTAWCCNELDIDLDLGISAPTILLELCLEARADSLETFDSVYQLCISLLTSDTTLTCARAHRTFSAALDTHSAKFNTYPRDFSFYDYHRKRGFYRDLSDKAKKILQKYYK